MFTRKLSTVAGGLALLAASIPLAARANSSPAAYVVDPLVKVTGGWTPSAAGGQTGVQLFAAGNEVASFQVALVGGASGASGVSAEMTPLADGDGTVLPAGGVTLFREAYLSISQPSDGGGGTGLYPDALVPDHDELTGEPRSAFPTDVPANQAGAIWVDVRIPAGQRSAVYTGTLQLSGGVSQQIPVQITVYPFDLPATSSLRSAFLSFTPLACAVQLGSQGACSTPAGQKLLSQYEQLALDHRFTLTNDNLGFDPRNGLAAFDQAITPFMNGSAPTRLSGAKMTSLELGLPQDAADLSSWTQNMLSQGWADRSFDYAADEPGGGASSWAQEEQNVSLAKQSAPDLPTLVTTSVQGIQQNGGVMPSILSPVINELDDVSGAFAGDQLPAYASFLQSGGKLWMYQSCMSHGCAFGGNPAQSGWPSYMIDASGVRNRAMQWADFEEGVQGELYYETLNAYQGDPWQNQYYFGGNGDGTLFYPGDPSKIGGQDEVPVASLRMKLLRAGMEDYEYLKKVSDLGDPGFAMAQAKTVVPTLHSVVTDPSLLHQARAALAARILQLTGASLPSLPGQGGGAPAGSPGSSTTTASSGGSSGQSSGTGSSSGSSGGKGGSGSALAAAASTPDPRPGCDVLVRENPRCVPGAIFPGASPAASGPALGTPGHPTQIHGAGCQTGAGSLSLLAGALALALFSLRRRQPAKASLGR